MKKLFALLFPVLLGSVVCGCEEDDSPIMFTTIENTAPQNVDVDYYSVDPACQPRRYTITTNRFGGELVMKCDNANNLYFGDISNNSRAEYGVTATGEVDVNTLVYVDANWSVSIVDNNSLKFVFWETPVNPDLDFVLENDFVRVCADNKNKVLETDIIIWRALNLEEPMN